MRRPTSLALALALTGTVATSAQPGASFTFPEDPGFVVLEYHQTMPMLEDADPVPLLRVYGDGRVRVHQPSYRVDAGDYELVLSPGELRQLVRSLADKDVPRTDVAALARSRRVEEERRRAERRELFAVSDATVTHIVMRLETLQPAPGARALENVEQRIEWPNLQSDAERFPELPQIASLAAAEREIRALLERPDLRRVR
jgi:hypothetical protein